MRLSLSMVTGLVDNDVSKKRLKWTKLDTHSYQHVRVFNASLILVLIYIFKLSSELDFIHVDLFSVLFTVSSASLASEDAQCADAS